MATIADLTDALGQHTGASVSALEMCEDSLRKKGLLPAADEPATAEHAVNLLLAVAGTRLGYEPATAVEHWGSLPVGSTENSYTGPDGSGSWLAPIEIFAHESPY